MSGAIVRAKLLNWRRTEKHLHSAPGRRIVHRKFTASGKKLRQHYGRCGLKRRTWRQLLDDGRRNDRLRNDQNYVHTRTSSRWRQSGAPARFAHPVQLEALGARPRPKPGIAGFTAPVNLA
jgi:hypothetical protein